MGLEVKNVINDFTDVAQTPNFRFFGNVEAELACRRDIC